MQALPSSKERELTVPHFKEFRSERQYSNLDENHQKFKKATVYSSTEFRQGAGGQPSETIRRGREESKFHPLEVLGVSLLGTL